MLFVVCVAQPTPRSRYDQLVQTGVLRGDRHQKSVVEKLQNLRDQLRNYDQPTVSDENQQSSIVRCYL